MSNGVFISLYRIYFWLNNFATMDQIKIIVENILNFLVLKIILM